MCLYIMCVCVLSKYRNKNSNSMRNMLQYGFSSISLVTEEIQSADQIQPTVCFSQ